MLSCMCSELQIKIQEWDQMACSKLKTKVLALMDRTLWQIFSKLTIKTSVNYS